MSKLNLTDLEDKDLVPSVISGLLDAFKTQVGQFPMAIVVTSKQATDHFIANNEVMPNFRGIPLEAEKKADETTTVIKTVNGIMAGMHAGRVADVRDVYSMLEAMKIKLESKSKQGVPF
jgi:hypothetical protein